MNKNCTLNQIAEKLHDAESVILYTHVQADGDSVGSAVALCIALRSLDKRAYILTEDEIPSYLNFLSEGYCSSDFSLINEPDICLAIDCSDLSRIEKRKEVFFKGKCTVCIDHHITNDSFADLNYIDAEAAATAEIIFRLLIEMNIRIDKNIAEALYAAIATDTGNFQYSNTTKDTHLITAALFDCGIDHNKISVNIYQNMRPEKVKITGKALSTMELFAGGKGNIAYVTKDMLIETGAATDETEGIVEQLRNISGVEISAFLKEDNDKIKVGLRSKTIGDVSAIARSFGGGGHKKAAGCTIEGSLQDAKKMLIEAIDNHLKSLEG